MKPAPFVLPPRRAPSTRPSPCSPRSATTARCSPAARAWSRCSPCGWPRPATWSTSTASPASTTSRSTRTRVRVGALARHAGARAARRRRTPRLPLLRQALRNVAHPTIRNRGTTVGSHRARRPGRRDAGGAGAARRRRRGRRRRRAPRDRRPPTSSSGRWSRRCARTSSPWRRASGGSRAGTRHGVRRGRPAARRLRAGRRRPSRSTVDDGGAVRRPGPPSSR